MSNYKAVAAMTETFRNTLHEAIADIPGADVKIGPPFQPKAGHHSHANGLINLFLFMVEPNPSWRNMELPVRTSDGRLIHRPTTALDLSYLLSFYGEQRRYVPEVLLGRTIEWLHARPYPSTKNMPHRGQQPPNLPSPFDLWDSGLRDQVHQIQLIPVPLSHEDLSRMWAIFFQTPYVLSVAYRCSVILIESDVGVPQAELPVRQVALHGISTKLPEIDRVSPQVVEYHSALRIELRGRNLTANCTVRISGREARVRKATGTSMLIDLPDGLVTGVQTIHVARTLELGDPPTPHRVYESAPASFVLLPVLRAPLVVENPPGVAPRVLASLDPPVAKGQRTALLLNRIDAPAEPSYTLAAAPEEHGILVRFAVGGVETGTYLARVQVDGAMTRLRVDEDPSSPTFEQYIAPEVVIP